MRDSGIPQAVRDIDLPEPATYKPYWLQRPSTISTDETVVEDKPVQERLALASQAIPGAAPAACWAAMKNLPFELNALHFHAPECMPVLTATCARYHSACIFLFAGFAAQLSGWLSDEHKHSSALEQRWTISDFAEAYTRGLTTPSKVAQRIINLIWEQDSCDPPMRMILAHIPDDLRKQAAASTARYDLSTCHTHSCLLFIDPVRLVLLLQCAALTQSLLCICWR